MATTQAIGDRFVTDNKFCVLQIPSAVTQGDYNFLFNPKHQDFGGIKIIYPIPTIAFSEYVSKK
jgi:RES domain-containing protein